MEVNTEFPTMRVFVGAKAIKELVLRRLYLLYKLIGF